jgi:hypothetical protein
MSWRARVVVAVSLILSVPVLLEAPSASLAQPAPLSLVELQRLASQSTTPQTSATIATRGIPLCRSVNDCTAFMRAIPSYSHRDALVAIARRGIALCRTVDDGIALATPLMYLPENEVACQSVIDEFLDTVIPLCASAASFERLARELPRLNWMDCRDRVALAALPRARSVEQVIFLYGVANIGVGNQVLLDATCVRGTADQLRTLWRYASSEDVRQRLLQRFVSRPADALDPGAMYYWHPDYGAHVIPASLTDAERRSDIDSTRSIRFQVRAILSNGESFSSQTARAAATLESNLRESGARPGNWRHLVRYAPERNQMVADLHAWRTAAAATSNASALGSLSARCRRSVIAVLDRLENALAERGATDVIGAHPAPGDATTVRLLGL